MFDVNNGNEDKDDLVYPAKYGLDNTVNVYFQSLDTRASEDRIGGWFIKYDLLNSKMTIVL